MKEGQAVKIVTLIDDVDMLDPSLIGDEGVVVGEYKGPKTYPDPAWWVRMKDTVTDVLLYQDEMVALSPVVQ